MLIFPNGRTIFEPLEEELNNLIFLKWAESKMSLNVSTVNIFSMSIMCHITSVLGAESQVHKGQRQVRWGPYGLSKNQVLKLFEDIFYQSCKISTCSKSYKCSTYGFR